MKSKAFVFFGVVFICLILLSSCSSSNKGELIYTTSEDVLIRMENKETFVVYLGTTSCSFCVKYKTELEKLVEKKDVTIYGVMVNEGNESNNQILMHLFQLKSTPETYWIVGGEKQDTLVGYMPYSDIVDWLQKNDLIQ